MDRWLPVPAGFALGWVARLGIYRAEQRSAIVRAFLFAPPRPDMRRLRLAPVHAAKDRPNIFPSLDASHLVEFDGVFSSKRDEMEKRVEDITGSCPDVLPDLSLLTPEDRNEKKNAYVKYFDTYDSGVQKAG